MSPRDGFLTDSEFAAVCYLMIVRRFAVLVVLLLTSCSSESPETESAIANGLAECAVWNQIFIDVKADQEISADHIARINKSMPRLNDSFVAIEKADTSVIPGEDSASWLAAIENAQGGDFYGLDESVDSLQRVFDAYSLICERIAQNR